MRVLFRSPGSVCYPMSVRRRFRSPPVAELPCGDHQSSCVNIPSFLRPGDRDAGLFAGAALGAFNRAVGEETAVSTGLSLAFFRPSPMETASVLRVAE